MLQVLPLELYRPKPNNTCSAVRSCHLATPYTGQVISTSRLRHHIKTEHHKLKTFGSSVSHFDKHRKVPLKQNSSSSSSCSSSVMDQSINLFRPQNYSDHLFLDLPVDFFLNDSILMPALIIVIAQLVTCVRAIVFCTCSFIYIGLRLLICESYERKWTVLSIDDTSLV